MWYFDSHLHHLKHQPGFTAAFAFIHHRPDLACKIASIDPDFRMYLLGVSTDSAPDWVNKVQNQLNHVLTHSSRLDDCGDWDQQANWTNRGMALWVRDEEYGADAGELKEEELAQKSQAAAAQAPRAKRKLTGEEPPPKKKKTASKPHAAKPVTGEDTVRSDGDEEEEDEEEEEEETDTSPAKKAKKVAARPGPEETQGTIRALFKQPARQSAPREATCKASSKR